MKKIITFIFAVYTSLLPIKENSCHIMLAPVSEFKTEAISLNTYYEEFLQNNYYNENEINLIKSLDNLIALYKKDSEPTKLQDAINYFKRALDEAVMTSDSHLNLSTFHLFQDHYLKYKDDPDVPANHIRYVRNTLLGLGTESLAIFDKQVGQAEHKEIYRQTHDMRLSVFDRMMASLFKPSGDKIVYYDMGASYGLTSINSYDALKTLYPKSKLSVYCSDFNMDHYIIYDKERKNRIFINGAKKVIASYNIEATKRNYFNEHTSYKLSKQYQPLIEELENQFTDNNRFAAKGDIIVEKVVLVAPEIKANKEMHALQHNIKEKMSDDLPKADIIRAANILQYFTANFLRSKILMHLLNKLNDGGLILLNYGQTTEDSDYIYALKKQGKHITILQTPHKKNHFLKRMFMNKNKDKDLIAIQDVLATIKYTTSVEDLSPDSLKDITSAVNQSA